MEIAVDTHRRPHPKAFPIRSDAALDVTEIVLQSTHRKRKLVTKVVEDPLLRAQSLDDLLPAGSAHSMEKLCSSTGTGVPETSRSSMYQPAYATTDDDIMWNSMVTEAPTYGVRSTTCWTHAVGAT